MSHRPFIHEDFLLETPAAVRLFHEYAASEPILDYHCHLSPQWIAENKQFSDLTEAWLEGDHYKWRAMRTDGVNEQFCTGDASPREKFQAWARTVPDTLRNPLYHWTHLELARYFGVTSLLNADTAEAIWQQANERLAAPEFTTQGMLRRFHVRALCTTDDPVDSLEPHRAIAASGCATEVFPAFRPDRALQVNLPVRFSEWVAALGTASRIEIRTFQHFLDALEQRHTFFHQHGCRLSDHGMNTCPSAECTQAEAERIFAHTLAGTVAGTEEHTKFASFLMLFFGHLDAKRGWTKQLHLGASRNNSSRMMRHLGPDTGFDSIGDWPQMESLRMYLDRLDAENALPKTILYNLNPADNYAFATMIGNFQDGSIAGKMQFGSGWWFLDQKEAIEWQINTLSSVGLLSRLVGMLTDSRSFLSFPRHEYFRRVLCNLLGRDMERGETPMDFALVGGMVRNICYANACEYLQLPTKGVGAIMQEAVAAK